MPILAFRCNKGHLTEKLVRGQDVEHLPCETCSGPAVRQSVYRVAVTGFARPPIDQREIRMGAFTEASAELAYKHERAENDAGKPLPAPPLWQMAKRKARKLQQMGVKDSADLPKRR